MYVIDFIGNGKSSRALVRKGQLRHVVQTTTAGQVFTVLGRAEPAGAATRRSGSAGHEYTPDERRHDHCAVQQRSRAGSRSCSRSGDFSSLDQFSARRPRATR